MRRDGGQKDEGDTLEVKREVSLFRPCRIAAGLTSGCLKADTEWQPAATVRNVHQHTNSNEHHDASETCRSSETC